MRWPVFFSFVCALLSSFLWGDATWKRGDWIKVRDAVPLMSLPMDEVFADELAFVSHLDSQQLLRSMEMVLLPGQQVQFVRFGKGSSIQVVFADYSKYLLYTDASAFFPEATKKPQPTKPKYISAGTILQNLLDRVGVPYFWGGNVSSGQPKMLEWYPNYPHEEALKTLWQCTGVDCSGLLYEATEGGTPRNTSGLKDFGEEVSYEGESFEHFVQNSLQPLDLLVFSGHVVIAIGDGCYIESTTGGDRVVRVVQGFDALRPFFEKKMIFVRRGLQKGVIIHR